MRKIWLRSVALFALALATPAIAEPGTVQGAADLAQRLSRYVGRAAFERKVLTVAPDPAGYRITFDIAPFRDAMVDANVVIEMPPVSVLVSPRPDGLWNVGGTYPDRIAAKIPSEAGGSPTEIVLGMKDGRHSGVVSPVTGLYREGTATLPSMSMAQKDPITQLDATFGPTAMRWTAQDRGSGEIDFSMVQTTDSIREVVVSHPMAADATAEPMPEMGPIEIVMDKISVGSDGTGLRMGAIQDLWTTAVQVMETKNAGAPEFTEELRDRLIDVLPLWKHLKTEYDTTGISVRTRFGDVAMGRFRQAVALDGVSPSGEYRIELSLSDLAIDFPQIPEFARELIPTSFDFAISAKGVDLETPANLFLTAFEPNAADPVPEDVVEAIGTSFKQKPPRLAIEPSTLRGPDYRIVFESRLDRTDQYNVKVTSLVRAEGIDGVIAKLQKIGTNEAFSAVGLLNFAKGFGKPGPDGAFSWEITALQDGSVTINGATIKGPTALEPEMPDVIPDDDTADEEQPL